MTNSPLYHLSNEELWALFPIILVEHQPHWEQAFREEKETLLNTLGAENIYRISHIGSTAVPGLISKPTIDILLEMKEESCALQLPDRMESAGYLYAPQPEKPAPHMMFMKGYTPEGFKGQVSHVHVRFPGDWDELYFRDYLREHPEASHEYGNLKKKLKQEYEHDRDAYTSAKTTFIQEITQLARAAWPGKYAIASQ